MISAKTARQNTMKRHGEVIDEFKKLWEKEDKLYVTRKIEDAIHHRHFECMCSWIGEPNLEYIDFISKTLENEGFETILLNPRDTVANLVIKW